MDQLKIYINRLKNEHIQKLDEILSPDFLDIHEEALHFKETIHVTGSIYLADDHLIAHLVIDAAAIIPCSICNGPVRIPIEIKDLYLSKPIADIKSAIYDLGDDIRESILLQVPQFVECNQGKCPHRQLIRQFLGKPSQEKKSIPSDTVHFPFSGLE